jgi:hypothetical protein
VEFRKLSYYGFFYTTSLKWLSYNEMNNATVGKGGVLWGLINPTPYRFREAGRADARSFAQNFVKLPPLTKYIKPKRIT